MKCKSFVLCPGVLSPNIILGLLSSNPASISLPNPIKSVSEAFIIYESNVYPKSKVAPSPLIIALLNVGE